jgi:DNA-directed RNA polymerase subunit RPC12/RpoP
MAEFKCPGAENIRTPIPEYIECPNCGKEVEIFSDELKARCYNCKKIVYKENTSSCIEWCKFASKCIGESKYKQIKRDREQIKTQGVQANVRK